jgi:PmbA protein
MFTSKDGEQTSSFNYDYMVQESLDRELIEWGMLDTLLRQSEEQIEQKPITTKFEGEVILTPLCIWSFLEPFMRQIQDGEMILQTSVLKDKLGKQVTSQKLNIKAAPLDDKLAHKDFITRDGFATENIEIIKDGVLQNFLLSQYGANKTSNPRAGNYGEGVIIEPGSEQFDQMVKSIKKGVLLCRFSGGQPAINGDFSGVAKNSYYIEDGKIVHPIQETMITGNLFEMFKSVKAISRESVNYGVFIFPWLQMEGLNISGQ